MEPTEKKDLRVKEVLKVPKVNKDPKELMELHSPKISYLI
jgi:hypothetical protein